MHWRQAREVLADVGSGASFPRWAILQEWQALRQVARSWSTYGNEIWLELVVERIEQGLQLGTFAIAGERYLLDQA